MPFRAAMTGGNDGQSANNSSTTLNLPGAAKVGDAAIIYVSMNVNTATCNTPAGFTKLSGPDDQSTNMRAYAFGRVLNAADIAAGSITVSVSATQRWCCAGEVLFDLNQSNPFGTLAVLATAGPVTTVNVPSLTTAWSGSDVSIGVTTRKNGTPAPSSTVPGTYLKDVESLTNFASGANDGCAVGHLKLPVDKGTAVGGGTMTISTSGSTVIYLVELIETPTGAWGVPL